MRSSPTPVRRLLVSLLVAAASCTQADGRAQPAAAEDQRQQSNLHEDFKGQALAAVPPPEAMAAVAAQADACPSERYRPLVHFTPRSLWMNDPNGLLYAAGEWHLFYQFNPVSDGPGNISWGHAVSADLVRWQELTGAGKPAIAYDGDRELIFSGSAVLDQDNTSGLGTTENPAMVAIYTSANGTKQAQSLAYSLDNGRTWTKFSGNPVLDEQEKEFRDPKVQWHAPTRRWLMAVAMADDRKVRFYSSPDLKVWTHLSDFGPMGAVEGQYECPDLFPLPVDGNLEHLKWVLVVNVNPGGLHGGSSAQYFIGDFDGERFVPDDSDPKAIRWLDYGKDYYAAVSWLGAPDGQRYMIGWMSNWQYAPKTPTSPWRNAMSAPRLMTLRSRAATPSAPNAPSAPSETSEASTSSTSAPSTTTPSAPSGLDLIQEPIPALASLLHLVPEPPANVTASRLPLLLARDCDGAFYLDVTVSLHGGATGMRLLLRGAEDGSAGTSVVWDASKGELAVDRRQSGRVDFSADFPGVHGAPLDAASLPDGRLRLKILVDEGSVEVFADGGRVAITDIIFPEEANKAVVVQAEGPEDASARLDDLRVTPLRPYRTACIVHEQSCHLLV